LFDRAVYLRKGLKGILADRIFERSWMSIL
jgi:hypothetical protein